jgi:hypothetical protein
VLDLKDLPHAPGTNDADHPVIANGLADVQAHTGTSLLGQTKVTTTRLFGTFPCKGNKRIVLIAFGENT